MSVAGVPQRRLHGEGPSDRETTSVFGQEAPFAYLVVRSFRRLLRPTYGHSLSGRGSRIAAIPRIRPWRGRTLVWSDHSAACLPYPTISMVKRRTLSPGGRNETIVDHHSYPRDILA